MSEQPEHRTARFDVIVVGAGPAGSTAALVAARAGKRVCLVERGAFPGAKNMYGGVIYGRILDDLIPEWWTQAPVQRWITRRSTVMLTPNQSLAVDFRTDEWGQPPYNGATAMRSDFDSWLASLAVDAGATLVCSTTVTGLIRHGVKVVGVTTDRPDGDLRADVVIACDGVNSFLAKEAGLYPHGDDPSHFTLGVKEVLALPRQTIEERFNLTGDCGADFEIIGCTGPIAGGGFLYTNLESVAVGVVLRLSDLAKPSAPRPEDLIGHLKSHSMIAPLVRDGELVEYSAHMIPESGYRMMPQLGCDGMLVAGDAAAFTLGAGLWLEGVNFAIGAGRHAASAAVAAIDSGRAGSQRTGSKMVSDYRRRLKSDFVLADHRRLRRAPSLVLSDRMQFRYPRLVCDLVQSVFNVVNPTPKPPMTKLLRQATRANGVKLRQLAADCIKAWRVFG